MTAIRPTVAPAPEVDDSPEAPWRVWSREWLFMHRATSFDARDAAQRWAREHLEGRLQADEVHLRRDDEGGVHTWVVMALLWNVRGEWKTEHQAAGHAETLTGDLEVAQVGSRAERRLRAVGQLMVASTEYIPWTEEDPRER